VAGIDSARQAARFRAPSCTIPRARGLNRSPACGRRRLAEPIDPSTIPRVANLHLLQELIHLQESIHLQVSIHLSQSIHLQESIHLSQLIHLQELILRMANVVQLRHLPESIDPVRVAGVSSYAISRN